MARTKLSEIAAPTHEQFTRVLESLGLPLNDKVGALRRYLPVALARFVEQWCDELEFGLPPDKRTASLKFPDEFLEWPLPGASASPNKSKGNVANAAGGGTATTTTTGATRGRRKRGPNKVYIPDPKRRKLKELAAVATADDKDKLEAEDRDDMSTLTSLSELSRMRDSVGSSRDVTTEPPFVVPESPQAATSFFAEREPEPEPELDQDTSPDYEPASASRRPVASGSSSLAKNKRRSPRRKPLTDDKASVDPTGWAQPALPSSLKRQFSEHAQELLPEGFSDNTGEPSTSGTGGRARPFAVEIEPRTGGTDSEQETSQRTCGNGNRSTRSTTRRRQRQSSSSVQP